MTFWIGVAVGVVLLPCIGMAAIFGWQVWKVLQGWGALLSPPKPRHRRRSIEHQELLALLLEEEG
jgi:hypothetical protein